MTDPIREDLDYKTRDHLFRARDEYAQGKYAITSAWLEPRIRPGQLLLNIGCGGGEYNEVAHRLGLRVVACEPEAEAFAIARAAAPRGEPSCELHPCGLLELPRHTGPADVIVMHDVLEHIEDHHAAVETVRSLLVPGGLAVISVPAYAWLFGHHDVKLGHYRRYTRRTLLPLFADGFEIETSRYYGAAMIPVALWYSRIAKRDYPVATAGSGAPQAALRWVCGMEARLPMPAGTSLLVRVRRRP